jgi:hypothetical protein
MVRVDGSAWSDADIALADRGNGSCRVAAAGAASPAAAAARNSERRLSAVPMPWWRADRVIAKLLFAAQL